MGELIKHKSIIFLDRGKQVKGVDCLHACAPIVQATTEILILILHQMNNYKCRYLDYAIVFTQVPTETDVCPIITACLPTKKENRDNMTNQHCLKLLPFLTSLLSCKKLSNNVDSSSKLNLFIDDTHVHPSFRILLQG